MSLIKEKLRTPFWALPIIDVLGIIETTKDGLPSEEVVLRQHLFGPNDIPVKAARTKARIFLRQFSSPLNLILLIAGILAFSLDELSNAIFIFLALLISIGLGFYQENKAESIMSKLTIFLEERAKVIRSGSELEIDAKTLVPGDIIHVMAGDRIPADARLIYANDLQIDESILTGESLPAHKFNKPVAFNAVINERSSMIHRGTLVAQGSGLAVATATGPYTEFGKIVGQVLKEEKERTPLQKTLFKFSIKLSLIILVLIAVFIVGVGFLRQKPLADIILLSLSVLVSSVPEGLPVALTFALALGVERLSKKRGVIRKLLAIETLGSASIILTDKTGTLTQAKISLSSIISLSKKFDEKAILELAILDSDVVIENPKDGFEKWRLIGRLIEKFLIIDSAKKGILLPHVQKKYAVLQHMPFNSKDKFSASVIEDMADKSLSVVVFGAPDVILNFSVNKDGAEIHRRIHGLASVGERVLGVGIKKIKKAEIANLYQKDTYADFELAGLISLKDPLRPEVKDAIDAASSAGVRTVIVTGDHEGTSIAAAKELGIALKEDSILSGQAVEELSDESLKSLLPHLKIVYRVTPDGKYKLARLYKELGEVVTMTGDGINDAPALKEADIGVAMGSGADIAKDVSDLVLLNDDYSTIIVAIEEGRRVMANIKKIIIYLFISLFDELFLIGGSLALGIGVPLTPAQILFINLILDGLPALSLAFEDRRNYLQEKVKKNSTFFDKETKIYTFLPGILGSIILLILYNILLSTASIRIDSIKTFIFLLLATELFTIFSIRDLQKPVFKYSPFSNKYLFISVLFSCILLLAAVYFEPLKALLGTASIPAHYFIYVVLFGFLNVSVIELTKIIIKKLKSRQAA